VSGSARLSGRPPFYDDTPQGVLLRIKAADYDFPATEWDYVSPEGLRTGPGGQVRQRLATQPCARPVVLVGIAVRQPRI